MQYLMLRAFFLPGKVTPEQQAFYVDLLKKVSQTAEYKEYLEKQALKGIFLEGKDMLKFLEEDDKLNTQLMTEAGFVAKLRYRRAARLARAARLRLRQHDGHPRQRNRRRRRGRAGCGFVVGHRHP